MRPPQSCLLYTSDAADDVSCVDLGGRRIIKKKFFQAEDGIRDRRTSRGLGDVYKRQIATNALGRAYMETPHARFCISDFQNRTILSFGPSGLTAFFGFFLSSFSDATASILSLIHI